MGDFYPQRSPGPTCHSAASHAPQYANYNTCHSGWGHYSHASSAPIIDLAEITSLKAKISVLEFELTERQKEIAQAQSVITYLLKPNACRGFHDVPMVSSKSEARVHGEIAALIAGEIKDSLKVLINRLPKDSGTISDSTEHVPATGHRNNVNSDSLIDFDDGCRDPKTVVAKVMGRPEHKERVPSAGATKAQSVQNTEECRAKDGLSQNTTIQKETFSFDGEDFPPLPYVTRFRPARTQNFCTTSSEKRDQAQNVLDDGTEPLLTSFDASSVDLSGSSQYDTSESTALTSLSSSFNSSDDEPVGLGACPAKEHPPKVVGIQKEIGSTAGASKPGGANGFRASSNVDAPAAKVSSYNSHGQAAVAANFCIPNWPTKSFTLSTLERERAIFIHQQSCGDYEDRFPELFKYGIRFRPEPARPDVYRTVVMDYLPKEVTMFAVLLKVRCGVVADARLLDTVSITGYLSALITFVHEHSAKTFVSGARKTPLRFGGAEARVTLVPTPTWPMRSNLRSSITDHGHTRCLELQNFPHRVTPAELERDLCVHPAMTTHRMEAKRKRLDGSLELRFTSIKHAHRAYGKLTNIGPYMQCTIKHLPDPCAQPWIYAPDQPDCVLGSAKLDAKTLQRGTLYVPATAKVQIRKEYAVSHKSENSNPNTILVNLCATEDLTEQRGDGDMNNVLNNPQNRGFSLKEHSLKTEELCKPQ